MLYYVVAALISVSSNVSTENFSPRNNKANVNYWIPKELPGKVNWKEKSDLLTRLTGTFIQQKCLHRGAVVSILWVFFPSFRVLICPAWIIIHSLMAAVTLSKMTDVESSLSDLCLCLSQIHTTVLKVCFPAATWLVVWVVFGLKGGRW